MNNSLFVITIKRMIRNRRKLFLVISATSISLILVMFSIVTYFAENYSHISLDSILSEGISHTGVIRIIDTDKNVVIDGQNFLNRLCDNANVSSAGAISYGNILGLDDLKNMVNAKNDLLYINCDAYNICPFELEEGTYPNSLNVDFFDNVTFVYLGDDYRGKTKIGQEFTTENGIVFKVAGFIKSGNKWLDPNVGLTIDTQQLDYSICLDSRIVVVEECLSSDVFLFSIYKDKDYLKTKESITNIAEECGYTISIQTLDEVFENSDEEFLIMQSFIVRMIFVVVFASVVITICTYSELLIENKHNIGIMYAIGFSKKQIMVSNILETLTNNIIEVFISSFMSGIMIYFWFKNTIFNEISLELFVTKVVPITSLMVLTISLITLLVLLFMLKRFTPSSLIGG